MLVTIITDASFCPKSGAAGYGYWIASKREKHGGGGYFKQTLRNSTEAEAKAIINGVYHALQKESLMAGDQILVQSDCIPALDMLKGKHLRTGFSQEIYRFWRRSSNNSFAKECWVCRDDGNWVLCCGTNTENTSGVVQEEY